jgi:hypothetical protein
MSMERREAKLNDMGVGPDSDILYIVSSSTNTSDTMEVFEQVVRVDTDTNDQAFTLTLPPVSLAKGKIYDIELVDDGADLTIQDNDDDAGMTDIVMDTVNHYVVLMSNGFVWRALVGSAASGI